VALLGSDAPRWQSWQAKDEARWRARFEALDRASNPPAQSATGSS
jgi:hypothetical protein